MLGKLLKYDFKNLYKTLLPLYLITVVITILTVILNNLSDTSNLFSTLNGLMILSYVVILMVLVIGTFLILRISNSLTRESGPQGKAVKKIIPSTASW